MAKIEIGGWKKLYKADLPPYFRSRIKENLTFANPEYVGLVTHRQRLMKQMIRMGEPLPPKKLKFYHEEQDYFLVPQQFESGMAERVVMDMRVSVPATIPAMLPEYSLWDIQKEAIAAWEGEGRRSGVLVIPTGSGKTMLGLEISRLLGERALVISNRDKTGVDTWIKDAKKFYGLQVGVIRGTELQYKTEPVVIATFQTLWSRKDVLDEIVDKFGVVIVDECQHVPARTFCWVVNSFLAQYRYGVTATEKRSDGLEAITFASLGKTIIERRKADEIVPVRLRVIRTGVLMPEVAEAKGDYTKSLKRLTLNDARNRVLANKIYEVGYNRHNLVVSHRVRHAKLLANAVAERVGVDKVALLVGSPKQQEKRTAPVHLLEGIETKQKKVIELARAGELMYVFATFQYAAEGLDVPIWDTLHMATPTKNEIELTQVIGRVRRAYPGKERCLVLDYMDVSGMFYGFYLARKKIYRKFEQEASRQMSMF